MDDRAALSWLSRSAGCGATPDEFAAALVRGAAGELERLVDLGPAADLDDPWDDDALPYDPKDRTARFVAMDGWITLMVGSSRPLVERMAWFWHGHFVSSLDKVRAARSMVDQARLFRRGGLGSYLELVRSVATDPAMLVYLDGRTSTADAPNENFARELMELFTLGVGNYTEADVQAAAAALSGWTVDREGQAVFRPRRHDDTVRPLLGAPVHDVDSVVGAVLEHPEAARFVTRELCRALLGRADDDLVTALVTGPASTLELAPLVRSILELGIAGTRSTVVLEPVRWLAICLRATGATLGTRPRLTALRAAGQLPMMPPNVAGWPGGEAWFGSSTVVARANLAAAVAAATDPGHPTMIATDPDDLSLQLGLAEPFGPSTAAVLRRASSPEHRLALALSSPEGCLS